jgi:hypothetical protein
MRKFLFAAALLVTACTATQVSNAVATGQLVCAVGPTVVALVDPTGAAVLATGATQAFVNAACALVNGVAVSPPASGVAQTVTITPPTIVLPLATPAS